VQYFAQQFSFTTRQMLNSIETVESCKKIEDAQQANVFKCQMLMSHKIPNGLLRSCDQVVPHQQHFLDHEQAFYTKHVLLIP